jgi:hypothetical protein
LEGIQDPRFSLQNHNISMKAFAGALTTNAATFSLSLREPRHWFDTSVTVRRNYYAIFLWLNLPASQRVASFKRSADSDDSDEDNPRSETVTSWGRKRLHIKFDKIWTGQNFW